MTCSPITNGLFQVEFDNDSDPDATIITISGRDKADLLMALTGSFHALELRVVSANILSRNDGRVLDNFRVTDLDDAKARPQQFRASHMDPSWQR